MKAPPERMVYLIRVKGTLDPSWSEWFDGMAVEATAGGETVLRGPIRDQTALHGLLGKIRDMGLPLLSLQQTTDLRNGAARDGTNERN